VLLQVTQRWTVPAAAGPGPLDLSTVAHSYSSTVDPVNDFYSGLFGMSMVAAKGALLPNGLVRGPVSTWNAVEKADSRIRRPLLRDPSIS